MIDQSEIRQIQPANETIRATMNNVKETIEKIRTNELKHSFSEYPNCDLAALCDRLEALEAAVRSANYDIGVYGELLASTKDEITTAAEANGPITVL
jgi:leucyl aminopeptidase (aminopeptidase T)